VQLTWTWLAVPWFLCALVLVAATLSATLVRGDRVLRIGTVGAGIGTMPWAVCSGLAACSPDAAQATLLLRLGNGPVALVGPGLLLVLLGVAGQLERHRWLARIAGAVGVTLTALCWLTPWTVDGVHELSSGIYYPDAAPLTAFHFSQLAIWMGIGLFIARRSVLGGGERRRLVRMFVGVLALGAVGITDMLLVYDIAGSYPIAWLPAMLAAGTAMYYVLRTDLLRPQGFDRFAAIEVLGFVTAIVIVSIIVWALPGAEPVMYALIAGLVWLGAIVVTWIVRGDDVAPVAQEAALGDLIASLGDVETEPAVADALTVLWRGLGIEVRATWVVTGAGELTEVHTGARRTWDPELAVWLAARGEVLAAGDLGTMRLGKLRVKIEALLGPAALVVPLVDRDTLVGLVEADRASALREDERGLVSESARAAARAFTYVSLSRAAAKERETAREVEIAEAMRLQASASRDDELGRWIVAAEYRTAAHTTGAGWSTMLLPDGRLAVLVTEAQAHGVAAALATAAVTGAFAAAVTTPDPLGLDEVLTSLRASVDGVMRGGEPVAAFVALVDAEAKTVTWATAGHPGGAVVGPIADLGAVPLASSQGTPPKVTLLGGGGDRLGASLVTATRGQVAFPPDMLLVIASSAVRGEDEQIWERALRERSPAGIRLASSLVDLANRRGTQAEDLLAVVVRQR